MSEIVKVKSGSMFEERNSYSRLVQAGDFVFVSNTAGRNYKTRAIADDVVGQCEQAFRNIEAALAAVEMTLKDVVAIRCHVPDPAETGAVGGFLDLGMIPVLGGDVLVDQRAGFSVHSGDAIAVDLARQLKRASHDAAWSGPSTPAVMSPGTRMWKILLTRVVTQPCSRNHCAIDGRPSSIASMRSAPPLPRIPSVAG